MEKFKPEDEKKNYILHCLEEAYRSLVFLKEMDRMKIHRLRQQILVVVQTLED